MASYKFYTFVEIIQMEGTYTKVSYSKLQVLINKAYSDSGMSSVDLSKKIGVKSTQTAKNALDTTWQVVSDEILTKVIKEVGLDAKVEWKDGKKSYLIIDKN